VGPCRPEPDDKASTAAERLIRAAVEEEPRQYIKGAGPCRALARYLKHAVRAVRDIRAGPRKRPGLGRPSFLEEGSGKESFARSAAVIPDAMMKEAEAIFEISAGSSAACPARATAQRPPFHQSGQGRECRALTEIRKPVRRHSPHRRSSARTSTASPFKLSDYRGKVVVRLFPGQPGARRAWV